MTLKETHLTVFDGCQVAERTRDVEFDILILYKITR